MRSREAPAPPSRSPFQDSWARRCEDAKLQAQVAVGGLRAEAPRAFYHLHVAVHAAGRRRLPRRARTRCRSPCHRAEQHAIRNVNAVFDGYFPALSRGIAGVHGDVGCVVRLRSAPVEVTARRLCAVFTARTSTSSRSQPSTCTEPFTLSSLKCPPEDKLEGFSNTSSVLAKPEDTRNRTPASSSSAANWRNPKEIHLASSFALHAPYRATSTLRHLEPRGAPPRSRSPSYGMRAARFCIPAVTALEDVGPRPSGFGRRDRVWRDRPALLQLLRLLLELLHLLPRHFHLRICVAQHEVNVPRHRAQLQQLRRRRSGRLRREPCASPSESS